MTYFDSELDSIGPDIIIQVLVIGGLTVVLHQ
jgi:hypothetical protein